MADTPLDDIAQLIARLAPLQGTNQTALDDLVFFKVSGAAPPMQLIYPPSLCLIAQGRKTITMGDETYQYDPSDYMVVSAHVPVTGHVVGASMKRPHLALRITLDPALVAEVASEIGTRSIEPARAIAVSRLDAPLQGALLRYLALLDAPTDRRILAPLVRREIVYRLLIGPQGARIRQMCAGDGQARRIEQALTWLRHHFAKPLRIESLARHVRMSPSALHHHFKSVTAMSPLQYQKRLRLHEARRLMIADGLDAAQASFRVGYESPSQFSREYRRVFGAPPRQSLQSGSLSEADQVQMAMVRTPTRLPSGERPTMRIETPTPST